MRISADRGDAFTADEVERLWEHFDEQTHGEFRDSPLFHRSCPQFGCLVVPLLTWMTEDVPSAQTLRVWRELAERLKLEGRPLACH